VTTRRRVALVVGCALAAPFAALGCAWLATPGVGDLARRVARHDPVGQPHAVSLDAIAPLAIEGLIATEDERYRSNSGIDVIGLMRAVPYDVAHLSLAQGGSTLTEQLTKNLWLGGSDQNAWRKLEDMALAVKLDRRYSKDTVLAAYLNTAYFGHGAYGIGAASRRYFGVAPAELTPVEATVLVGLVQAPTSDDPYTHPAASRVRQIAVLRSLVRVGRLSVSEAARLLAAPLPLADGQVVSGMRGVDLSPGSEVPTRWVLISAGALLATVGVRVTRRAIRGRPART
jgi:membrane peptidoglycan carboxypeptidase